MSRHKVKIYPLYEIEDPGDIFVISQDVLNSAMMNGNVPRLSNNHNVAPTLHMNSIYQSGLKTLYYQNTKNSRVLTRELNLLEFAEYEQNVSVLQHKEDLPFSEFHNLLFDNDFVTLAEKNSEWINNYFKIAAIKDDMIIHLEFTSSKGKLTLVGKEFKKEDGFNLIPYFDENIPSSLSLTNASAIRSHQHVVFDEDRPQTYLKLHHYKELSVLVYTIVNPDENKVVPALIVTDMTGKPLEVHCYYQKELVNPEMIKELKPNLITEDFQSENYFNSRDLELLDMARI